MNVIEFMAQLSYGPLSNLAIGNEGNGVIVESKHAAIVSYLNEGLLRLHSKFILNEKELVLEQREAITSYHLHSDYAVSTVGTAPTDDYIRDTIADPFTNDLIKVLSVWETGGCQLPLNDDNHNDSLYTPKFDVLQVPNPVQGAPLYILYQAKHPTISVPESETDADTIDIPDVLNEALLSFVAHKVFFHMNGAEHTAKASDYLNLYEASCKDVLDRDLVNSSMSHTRSKFNQRGFV